MKNGGYIRQIGILQRSLDKGEKIAARISVDINFAFICLFHSFFNLMP
jgi:hypothetical protein